MESNTITLGGAWGKVAQQDYHIQPCKNPKTGMYPDCVRMSQVSPDGTIGQMILSEKDLNEQSKGKVFIPAEKTIVVKHGTTFDLNNPIDAAKWDAIKYCKFITDNRLAVDENGNYVIDGEKVTVLPNGMASGRYGVADLYVERPGIMSKGRNEFRKLVAKAVNFIMDDSLDGMVKKCRLLEKDMSRANSNDVEDYLMSIAEKTPEKIINLYTGSDSANRLLIIDAMEKHVLVRKDSLIMYGDTITRGTSIDSAITYLTSPQGMKLKELIMRETYPDLFPEDKPKAVKK